MMRIESVRIKGFRNFVDETVLLSDKTLIIGGNDVGKSNLLQALRLLLDPTLSTSDLELSPGDFNIQSNAELVQITAKRIAFVFMGAPVLMR